jgi:serine/threonine-protein kinase
MSSDPQNFGKYQIQSRLGQGGMSTVYVARDPDLGREVAIKVLSSHLTSDPQFAERFMREAQAMARLEHPAILPVYDFGQQEGTLFLVMRLLSGGTLAQRLRGEPERDSQLDAVLTPIAAALDYAHSRGVLHRDVKPANIGFDHRGQPYLMDFGLAYLALQGAALTQTGAMLGTPSYMAPEQARGEPPTSATDIYALGVVAYEMLSGKPPFSGDTAVATMLAHITAPPPSIRTVRPEMPQAADEVLQRALAKDSRERYATAREFMEALLTALDATRVIRDTWQPAIGQTLSLIHI